MPRADKRLGKRWSYTAGAYGHSVRVYERRDRSTLYAAEYDPETGEEKRHSLGHADCQKAQDYADDRAKELRRGERDTFRPPPTVERVLNLYKRYRTPDKSVSEQQADARRMALWKRVLGPKFDLSKLSRREWDGFVRKRRSGVIGPRGEPVAEKKRRPVGERTVEVDLKFLRAVCRWAGEFRDGGELLLERDPTRGLELPKERNPSRAVATHDRVDAVREHYQKPTMMVYRNGTRETVPSYLPEIFEIVVGTGRRISAVCGLRHQDLDLERRPNTPHGAIVWREDTDKMGKRWRCPISATVREALERALVKRGTVGAGPLFPAPRDPKKPIRYELASEWLREAEEAAEVKGLDGTLWHAYRRLWASARKDLPDVDVAQAGGWSSLAALKMAYQQPDDATMLRVVEHGTELREVK